MRRQAKWVFVFLALVFGVSFVVFGVGSDVPGGIADILQGRNASGQPSVGDARERLEKNPLDAKAMRDLATALQTEGETDQAIEALERYLGLEPGDESALRELATLQLGQASRLRVDVQQAQLAAQQQTPASPVPSDSSPFGQALAPRPITDAVAARANGEVARAYDQLQFAYRQAADTYQRLAAIQPEDPSIQLQLADAAQNSGDTTTAIAAYRRFLTLAPDDPRANLVKQEIERLQSSAATASSGG